jgi:hypothetical protein
MDVRFFIGTMGFLNSETFFAIYFRRFAHHHRLGLIPVEPETTQHPLSRGALVAAIAQRRGQPRETKNPGTVSRPGRKTACW